MSNRPRQKGAARRSYLKRWSSSVLKAPSQRVDGEILREVISAKNSGIFLDPRLYHLFTVNGNRPRIEIVKRLRTWTDDVRLEHNILLTETPTRKLYMFFVLHGAYFFVCVEFSGTRIRKSRKYLNRERAMQVYEFDPKNLTGIDWQEQYWD